MHSWLIRDRAGKPGGGKGPLIQDEISGTNESEPIAGYHNLNDNTTAESGIDSVVRRLTPLECERLQGFPDNHTRIPWKGKPAEECPDSLRYKACGNSMAVPVMRWLGERIEAVDRL